MGALRAVRYAGDEYYWVNNTAGMMLMHPTDKSLENTSVMGVKNSSGVAIFSGMIDVARTNGGGFYRYEWKNRDDPAPRAKIAYVTYIPEWDWVVGTGVYVDDIDALYQTQAWRLGGSV